MKTVSVEKYEKTSKEIGQAKTKIFDALAALHDHLVTLSALERDLEVERVQGVTHVRGLAHNAPELIEPMNAHNAQLVIPTSKVWSLVDNAISLIEQHNRSAMNGSVDQLPEAFGKLNRVQEFTTGQ